MGRDAIQRNLCPECSAELSPGERVCPHCGAPTHAQANHVAEPSADELITPELVSDGPERPPPRRDVAESRWAVLVLLFAALGPLALHVLWRSPRFSPGWKVVLTLLVVIFTVVVVVVLWYAVDRCVDVFREAGVIGQAPQTPSPPHGVGRLNRGFARRSSFSTPCSRSCRSKGSKSA